MRNSKIAGYLLVYGFTHALVDASCIILILGGIDVRSELLTFIVIYNVLAFGLQLPLGWIIDQLHKPILSAILGCICVAFGLMFFMHPIFATILAGIGNALFHVGGGTVSLNLRPGKAAMPGVFVAPGGIGLVVGGVLLKSYGFIYEIFVVLLLCMVLIIFQLKSPIINYGTRNNRNMNYPILIIMLLLVTICIRSGVGLSMSFPWKSQIILLMLLTFCIALGKGLGGFLADYFGWIKIAVGGLIISALLLFYGTQTPAAGIIGMFLYNLTMPVTLVAVSNLLPGKPGFSFGLTTFALMAGALPSFFNFKDFLSRSPVIFFLVVISAVFLFSGLRLYNQNMK